MATSSCTALIPLGVEEVWSVLARFGDISEWGTGVSQSNLLTEASDGPGATRRVQVGRNALRETVTHWQPPCVLGYGITGLPPVVREASNTWVLSAAGEGTRVTLTSAVATKGGPLVSRLVARKLGKAGKQLVGGLEGHLAGTRASS
jgi:hypothetical protein